MESKVERICVKCGKPTDNGLPMCSDCKTSLSEFNKLADYLNHFSGSKEDMLWLIGSEISRRQSSIINSVKVIPRPDLGIIEMVPIEPSSSTLKGKPWLWDRFLNIKETIKEIGRLYRAENIARKYYEVKA